jgi:protein TonB
MADVLIVCVREDEPQAKALAEMFEAAGFSIGGAPTNDSALRSSGAGVVVWSQASIRSRPFLDAAQRVINAEKAVVASLIEPPPPDSIGNSLAFDLSDWDGDPNDPALDPLFFAVDRLVNAARASVGASASPRPSAYDDPPPRPAPPPRSAPPPRATPAPRVASPIQQASPDALSSEAEHWRAIRDSQDPNAFMEYLARYGQRGTFSEVAELKLKQLTAGGATARPPSPLRSSARAEAGMPQSRRPDIGRRIEAPTVPPMAAPTPRRPEAPRRSRTAEPAFDRTDLREPPAEGGALRTFIIIALLGVLAVAGGLYFGGGLGQPNDTASVAAPAADPDAANGDGGGEPIAGSVSFADAADASAPTTGRNTREPPVAPPRTREPERTTTERPPRAPETSNRATAPPNTNAGGNGPVSLTPGSSSPSPSGPDTSIDGAPAPLPPFIASASPEAAVDTSRPAAPGTVVFTQRPTPRRISELYPQGALRRGVGGRVQLDCRVQYDLSLTCSVASESPADAGFGRAALAASSSYRARATLSDGSSAVGAQTRIAVNFQAPQ